MILQNYMQLTRYNCSKLGGRSMLIFQTIPAVIFLSRCQLKIAQLGWYFLISKLYSVIQISQNNFVMVCSYQPFWMKIDFHFNSRTPRDLRHFGNPKNENLLRSLKSYGENEFPVKMCISHLKFHDQSFFPNCKKTEPQILKMV